MTRFGLNGTYVVGFRLLAVNDKDYAQQKQQQKSAAANVIKSSLNSITLTDVASIVTSTSAVDTIQGLLRFYPAATLSQFSNLMSPSTLSSVLGECCKALAAKTRAETTSRLIPSTEIDLGIKETDFLQLKVSESVGFTLPMYEFTFVLHNKAFLKYLNRTSEIELTWGRSEADAITMPATIYNVKQGIQGDDLIITLTGFFKSPDYLTVESHMGVTGTSYDVFKQYAPQFNFKFNSNITQTNDAMIWKADNVLPREFFTKVWQHSFISQQSQLLTSIDVQGRLNFKDISILRQQAANKTMQLFDRLNYKENTFYANFGSMRKQRYVYNLKTGTMSLLNLNDTSGAIVSTKIDKKLAGNRIGKFAILSPEMHDNWYIAELLNQAKLCGSLAQIAPVLIPTNWKRYELLDIVTVKSPVTSECGQYIVAGKMYNVYNRQLNTYLQLARDTYAPITGSFNAP